MTHEDHCPLPYMLQFNWKQHKDFDLGFLKEHALNPLMVFTGESDLSQALEKKLH